MSLVSCFDMTLTGSLLANLAEGTVADISKQIASTIRKQKDLQLNKADLETQKNQLETAQNTANSRLSTTYNPDPNLLAQLNQGISQAREIASSLIEQISVIDLELSQLNQEQILLEQELKLANIEVEYGNKMDEKGTQMAKGAMKRIFSA